MRYTKIEVTVPLGKYCSGCPMHNDGAGGEYPEYCQYSSEHPILELDKENHWRPIKHKDCPAKKKKNHDK